MDIDKISMDLSRLNHSIDSQSLQMSSLINDIDRQMQEKHKREEEARLATLKTAENTAEIKDDMKNVIRNQNAYIDLLKVQLEEAQVTIAVLTQQLDLFKEFFSSEKDQNDLQTEILKLMQEKKVDIKTLLVEKGADAVLQTIISMMPLALNALGAL